MKIAVIVFPGSNCDIDLYEALRSVCHADVEYVSHREKSLAGFDAVMLPGGFSYGDYLRAGAIARFTNIMPAVIKMAEEGKPVFGTCNGFQILTEVGLLPGALKRNDSQKFVCKTVPWKWLITKRSLLNNMKSTNESLCQLLMLTAVILQMKRRLTALKRIIRLYFGMLRKTQMAVCVILRGLLMNGEMFWE